MMSQDELDQIRAHYEMRLADNIQLNRRRCPLKCVVYCLSMLVSIIGMIGIAGLFLSL